MRINRRPDALLLRLAAPVPHMGVVRGELLRLVLLQVGKEALQRRQRLELRWARVRRESGLARGRVFGEEAVTGVEGADGQTLESESRAAH